jgi:hypothetical protein
LLAGDCARYGLYSRFAPAQKTTEAAIREQAETIKDPLGSWSYLHFDLPRVEDATRFRQNFRIWWQQ